MTEPRFCALVPTYDNPATVAAVVESLRVHFDQIIVVDDGSAPPGRRAVEALGRAGLAHVLRREKNGGKGAAVKEGLRAARELGYTHALQIDADGQHDVADVPAFLAAARGDPSALVLGRPIFDHTAPSARLRGRKITTFWVYLEGASAIADALCGYRLYPIEKALSVRVWGNAMDFDPEIAVRLVWAGLPVINVPTKVCYVDAADGGVSHFRMFRDNVLISFMHARLATRRFFALMLWPLRRRRKALPG